MIGAASERESLGAFAPATTSAVTQEQAPPATWAATRVELAKLAVLPTTRIVLGVCLLAPLGFALVMRVQSAVPADTLFGRWAAASGFATSLTMLGFAGTWGLPILAGLIGGDSFSSEDRHGTWKTLLTRSCARGHIFLGKSLAVTALAVAALVVLALSSVVSAVALVGTDPLVGLSGQLVPAGDAARLVLASWGFMVLPMLVFVALAVFLSVVSRSGVVGVLGPAVIGLVLQLLSLLGSGEVVRAILPSTPFDAWHGLFTTPRHYDPLLRGAIASIAWIMLLAAASRSALRRRDFAGSDAVSSRPSRTPVRAAAVAAALVAVLAAAAGWGPTDVTAARLEQSIAPTFDNLVVLQYRRRTHSDQSTELHTRATCGRSGVTGTSRGPGEDWTCSLRVLRPQVSGAAVNLDVSVHANGCYTAQAPASLVGQQRLRDVNGSSFVNPVYAFEGCLGTP